MKKYIGYTMVVLPVLALLSAAVLAVGVLPFMILIGVGLGCWLWLGLAITLIEQR